MTSTLSRPEHTDYNGFVGNFDVLYKGSPEPPTEQAGRLPTELAGNIPATTVSETAVLPPGTGGFSGNLFSDQVVHHNGQPHGVQDPEAQQLLLYSLKLRDPDTFQGAFAQLSPGEKDRFDAFEAREDARIKDKIPAAAKLITKLSTEGQKFMQAEGPKRVAYDDGGFYNRGLLDREMLDKKR